MLTKRAIVAFTLAFVAAGCLQAQDDQDSTMPSTPSFLPDWAEIALPSGEGHDHFNVSQHRNLSTPNFDIVGWDPLIAKSLGHTAGGYFCGESRTRADGRRIAVVNSFYSGLGFVLADVTDPAHPFEIGEMRFDQESVYDVALTPDGMHVVVGANPDPQAPAAGLPDLGQGRAEFRDACTGETRVVPGVLPLNGPSIILVGIANPQAPVIEDVVPMPVIGPHSVGTYLIDGEQWVTASVVNLQHQSSYFAFYTVSGSTLQPRAVYQAPPPASTAQPIVNGHVDASMMKHPITKQTLAYLADWDQGLIILDMDGPIPQQLGTFNKFTGGGGYLTGVETGNFHEAIPAAEAWDGRHYVIVGQEILSHPVDHPSGWVWILDDTDPANVQEVGRWTLPAEVEWGQSLQFSTHYMSLLNRTMFVSLYHGGVWAVDLSTPDALRKPPSIGVFIPANESPMPGAIGGSDVVGTPTVMEAWATPEGEVVVFDAQSGVYMVRFDASNPAPALYWEG